MSCIISGSYLYEPETMQPKNTNDRSTAGRNVRSAPPVPTGFMEMKPRTARSGKPANDPASDTQLVDDMPALPPEPAHPAEPEEAHGGVSQPAVASKGAVKRCFSWIWHHKKIILPAAVVVVIAGLFAVPQTRYPILALGLRRAYNVTVADSKTATSISGATVTIDGATAQTDARGHATLTVRVGRRMAHISKQYYQALDESIFVGISTAHNAAAVQLAATGRQVPVKVTDKVTGKPIVGAVIKSLDTSATTDDNGQATIVLPTTAATQPATISADGHNDLSANIVVTDQPVAANTFAVTPAGRMYFLSNLSGKIDVVSANLDGSARTTVLAGTGSEDTSNTVLLASRDWKYLALLSRRTGSSTVLYLISTSTGKLTTIDSTAGNFALIGWSGHYFVYKLNPDGVQNWQPGGTVIKSYNADAGNSVTLVTSNATGSSDANAEYENIWDTVLMGNALFYDVTWYIFPGSTTVSGQQDMLNSVQADGSAAKTLKSVDASQYYIGSLKQAAPNQAYFGVYSSGSNASNYYRLDGNGNITQNNTITSDSVTKNYPTYLVSPSGASTFWAEQRDGKNTLFVGDASGNSATQIATLSDYSPYGWFTDNFLLVQKNGSELYILPAAGGTALKVSDYYKPDANFYGYGGGYGGL